jgi:biopolymer transport protein ExbD
MVRVRARRKPDEAEIIIIPMIDTMMFLLMFFIVASLALVVQNGLPVNLPKASTAVPHSALNVTVTIGAAGDIHVNTKLVTLDALTDELKAAGTTAGTLVIINADAAVTHGLVTTVMDDARKAGVERFAIATKA